MNDVLWELNAVCVGPQSQPRLRGLSATLAARGHTAIVGPSGAGKSTLLAVLVGLCKPDAGSVRRVTLPECREEAGWRLPLYWVPQHEGLWPGLRAWEQVAAAMGARRQAEAMPHLDAMALADRALARREELSQGEASRLAVARALAARPAVLLMDEPLAHVDHQGAERCWGVIEAYTEATGAVLIFTSHDPQRILAHAEHVLLLRDGEGAYAGSAAALYEQPATAQLAWALGPHNWFEDADAWRLWVGEAAADDGAFPRCVRPERMVVEAASGSALRVASSRTGGAVGRTVLRHEGTGASRTVYHRAAAGARGALAPGSAAMLRILATWLLCLGLVAGGAGCGDGTAVPTPFTVSAVWGMPAAEGKVPQPRALALYEDGRVLVIDTIGRILELDAAGEVVRSWMMPETEIGHPEGLCILQDGRIAVADTHYSRVVIFTAGGEVDAMFGEYGTGPGQFIYPVCVAQDAAGDLYVGEYGQNDRVQKFSVDGRYLLEMGHFGTGPGEFQRASAILVRGERLLVVDSFNNRVQIFNTQGHHLGVLGAALGESGPQLEFPYDIAAGPDGTLLVVEYRGGRVTWLDETGRTLGRYGSSGYGQGQLATPWALACDEDARVLVADTANRRIVELALEAGQ